MSVEKINSIFFVLYFFLESPFANFYQLFKHYQVIKHTSWWAISYMCYLSQNQNVCIIISKLQTKV